MADAIVRACDEIAAGRLHEAFIVDPIQGGAGTSLNMNANEVIANRAIELLGGEKGDYALVNPNDHVNYGQSTNDVFPSAGKLAVSSCWCGPRSSSSGSLRPWRPRRRSLTTCSRWAARRAGRGAHPSGAGVPGLQPGGAPGHRPLRAGQGRDAPPQHGGTAIGTGINADERYLRRIIPNLSKVTGLELVQASDLIDATQNLDGLVAVSGAVKTCAVNLSKMSNDLRLMSSGPRCGFSEINLPPRQNGSSIMPGKVNPVIPEVVSQVAFNIIGNDVTVTMAAEAGQLELNAFEPIIFYNLIQSVETLTYAVHTFVDNCVTGITANRERCRDMVEHSVGIITALCPHVGYEKAAEVAKRAIETGAPVRRLILEEGLLDEAALDKILDPYSMTEPGISGKELLEG